MIYPWIIIIEKKVVVSKEDNDVKYYFFPDVNKIRADILKVPEVFTLDISPLAQVL